MPLRAVEQLGVRAEVAVREVLRGLRGFGSIHIIISLTHDTVPSPAEVQPRQSKVDDVDVDAARGVNKLHAVQGGVFCFVNPARFQQNVTPVQVSVFEPARLLRDRERDCYLQQNTRRLGVILNRRALQIHAAVARREHGVQLVARELARVFVFGCFCFVVRDPLVKQIAGVRPDAHEHVFGVDEPGGDVFSGGVGRAVGRSQGRESPRDGGFARDLSASHLRLTVDKRVARDRDYFQNRVSKFESLAVRAFSDFPRAGVRRERV
mmetsp:Transcript_12693/g.47475  ORF Transcript_12693/g.47475 Transcript_12693/m.47475 type:complete len:265 (+) Transcript_12693:332-1126(+)